jgi:hypothetical protein
MSWRIWAAQLKPAEDLQLGDATQDPLQAAGGGGAQSVLSHIAGAEYDPAPIGSTRRRVRRRDKAQHPCDAKPAQAQLGGTQASGNGFLVRHAQALCEAAQAWGA